MSALARGLGSAAEAMHEGMSRRPKRRYFRALLEGLPVAVVLAHTATTPPDLGVLKTLETEVLYEFRNLGLAPEPFDTT